MKFCKLFGVFLMPRGGWYSPSNNYTVEAVERRRYELHAEDIRHQLETRENSCELHGGVRRQELRGEEHSRELEATT